MFVGALDGSGEQQLTSGAMMPVFAGYARDSGTTWLYYTSAVQHRSDAGAAVTVHRSSINGRSGEDLFTFQADAQGTAASEPLATASPDGRYVAYTDERGLRLYDVTTHVDRGLLGNRPQSPTNAPGNIYLSPLWAPAGGWLVLTRTGYPPYDKPTLDFIRPLEPITEYTADAGGVFRAWSPDGKLLCASRAGQLTNGYAFDDVGLVTPGQSAFEPLIHRVTVDKPGDVPTVVVPTACAWSADGRVAISYDNEHSGRRAITVFDTKGAQLSQVGIDDAFAIAGWLPDGNGVIRGVEDEEDERLLGQNLALLLDGSFRSLPFSPARVLAVIPPP